MRLRRSNHERDAVEDVGFADRRRCEGAGTKEADELLEGCSQVPASWDHPGLLHLYVHLMEMSPFPQRALRAGNGLRDLMPDAGHLIHMPTHIDVLCGNYRDVLDYNQRRSRSIESIGTRRGGERLFAVPHPQLSLRDLRRDVPWSIHARARSGTGADRHHAGRAAAHPLTADGRLHRRLPPDEASCPGALRQVAGDHRRSFPRTATSTARQRR